MSCHTAVGITKRRKPAKYPRDETSRAGTYTCRATTHVGYLQASVTSLPPRVVAPTPISVIRRSFGGLRGFLGSARLSPLGIGTVLLFFCCRVSFLQAGGNSWASRETQHSGQHSDAILTCFVLMGP